MRLSSSKCRNSTLDNFLTQMLKNHKMPNSFSLLKVKTSACEKGKAKNFRVKI